MATGLVPYVIRFTPRIGTRVVDDEQWLRDPLTDLPREFRSYEAAKRWASLSLYLGVKIIKKPWKGKYHE